MRKIVQIKILGGTPSLIAAMAEMRDWLNRHGCEPLVFDFRKSGERFSIQVAFERPEDTAAFEKCFGRLGSRSPVYFSDPPNE